MEAAKETPVEDTHHAVAGEGDAAVDTPEHDGARCATAATEAKHRLSVH